MPQDDEVFPKPVTGIVVLHPLSPNDALHPRDHARAAHLQRGGYATFYSGSITATIPEPSGLALGCIEMAGIDVGMPVRKARNV
jgi:hypothetical protein